MLLHLLHLVGILFYITNKDTISLKTNRKYFYYIMGQLRKTTKNVSFYNLQSQLD